VIARTLVFILLVAINSRPIIRADKGPTAAMFDKHFNLIENHCLDCHDDFEQKDGINLETLSFQIDTVESAELWQKVLNVMNVGEMPPKKKRQPPATKNNTF